MADFTSSLYLGLDHSSRALRHWARLTTGKPAVLQAPPREPEVGDALARLQGCEAALLGPSTLHLFWDLLGALAREPAAVLIDADTYPIARWGAERLVGRGTPVLDFRHRDADQLARQAARVRADGRRPLVIADGLCPGCGRPLPLTDYLAIVDRLGGWLILDDTQALGLLGSTPSATRPFGYGGGGSLRWHGIDEHPRVLLICSLAKGFGAPLAALSGPARAIDRFAAVSETRLHCSAPSAAVIEAARHALAINACHGENLRSRLLGNLRRLGSGLRRLGLQLRGGWFPVQTLMPGAGLQLDRLHDALLGQGIATLLHPARRGSPARMSFILSARHRPGDIDDAIAAIADLTDHRDPDDSQTEKPRAAFLSVYS